MKIPIPDYLIENLLRHTELLMSAIGPSHDNTRVSNAVRLGRHEVRKIKSIIRSHKNGKSHDGQAG